MVANDRRSHNSQDSTCFYAVMFTEKPHESPYRLINFNKIVEWEHRTVDTDYGDSDDLFAGKSLFLNAFLLEQSNIMTITSKMILVIKDDLALQQAVKLRYTNLQEAQI